MKEETAMLVQPDRAEFAWMENLWRSLSKGGVLRIVDTAHGHQVQG